MHAINKLIVFSPFPTEQGKTGLSEYASFLFHHMGLFSTWTYSQKNQAG